MATADGVMNKRQYLDWLSTLPDDTEFRVPAADPPPPVFETACLPCGCTDTAGGWVHPAIWCDAHRCTEIKRDGKRCTSKAKYGSACGAHLARGKNRFTPARDVHGRFAKADTPIKSPVSGLQHERQARELAEHPEAS